MSRESRRRMRSPHQGLILSQLFAQALGRGGDPESFERRMRLSNSL